jgi:hypothetical protein
VRKYILALAAVAALVPASSAMAADELRLSGPSATLVNLLTGGTSGGGPIVFGGQQINGLQANGAARYREKNAGTEREIRVSANDVNSGDGAPVFSFLVDTTPAGVGFEILDTTNLNGTSYKLDSKTVDGGTVPNLGQCGSVVVGLPLAPLSDIILATLTQSGDPLQLLIGRPAGC